MDETGFKLCFASPFQLFVPALVPGTKRRKWGWMDQEVLMLGSAGASWEDGVYSTSLYHMSVASWFQIIKSKSSVCLQQDSLPIPATKAHGSSCKMSLCCRAQESGRGSYGGNSTLSVEYLSLELLLGTCLPVSLASF